MLIAHATPVQYVPVPSSQYQEMPEEIRVQFSERVKGEGSAVEVFRQDGTKVSDQAVIKVGDPYTMIAKTDDGHTTSEGVFTVSWRVTSADDGHYSQGAFAFTVGEKYARNAATIGDPHVTYVRKWWETSLRALLMAVGVAIATKLWWLAQKSTPSPKAGKTVFFVVGTYLFLSFAAVLAAESHAAASHFAPNISQIIMWLHILAKECWLGVVIAMAILWWKKADSNSALLMRRGLQALGAAVVTGGYVMWLHLKDVDNLSQTEWGRVSVAVLVAGLVTAAAWIIAAQHKKFAHHAWVMALIGCSALVIASTWISFTVPPLSSAPEHIATTTVQNVPVTLGYATYPNQSIVIQLPTATKTTIVPQVALTTADGAIGPSTATMQKEAPYGYGFSVHELMPLGLWDIKITVPREVIQTAQGDTPASDIVAHFEVDSNHFLHNADTITPPRKWDSFATNSALLTLLAIAALYVVSKHVDSKNTLK
jgi:methionine-rich copper-binding protein CopC